MNPHTITTEEASDGGVLLRVHGAFDAAVSSRVAELLASAEPDAHVVLDLSPLRSLPDTAVALLAHAMSRAPCGISLVGLGHHQHRILRYFGVVERQRPAGQPRAEAAAD